MIAIRAAIVALGVVAAAALPRAQQTDNQPVEPFRIAGNLYYVGASDISSYLIATPVDIFIGAHPSYYGGIEKAARAKASPGGPNPFIDPDGYRRYVDDGERRFRERLAREKGWPPLSTNSRRSADQEARR